MNPITIRRAGPADEDTIRRLAALDGARVPRGQLLIAELRGRPIAALPLEAGSAAIADPFERTSAIVGMLEQARGVPGAWDGSPPPRGRGAAAPRLTPSYAPTP